MLEWKDKQDGIDDVLAEDINNIAHAVIGLEENANKNVVDQTYAPTSENAQSGKAVAEAVSGKQNTLVSGTNIKTINGNSILGSGNITIEGGSGSSITIDQTFDPDSENAQSGKAVKEAVSDKQDSLVSGTNIKTINNQSILGSGNITIEGGSDVEVDQNYLPTSKNAQSGKAVAEAIASTVEIKPSKIDLPFEYKGGNSGEYFAKLISIDKISNTRSYLRFEFGGSTSGVYVNCPKDELVTYGLEIGKFYFIKISGEQFSDKTIEIQKFSKISIDQSYNPDSENAQSGKAVAEAVSKVNVDLSNYYTKEETDNKIGDIETALDNIIAIQNSLIGGGNV